MPISPDMAWNLAEPVVDVYARAEALLLARLARYVGAGLDAPDWLERRLLETQLLQRQVARDLLILTTQGPTLAAAATAAAWNRGEAAAIADLARVVVPGLRRATSVQSSLYAITREVTTSLQAVHQRVLRAVPDVYREVVQKAAPQVLVGTQTRRQAAQSALDDLASRGISGFTDSRGRQWALDTYVEMATRAATGRAAVAGHVTRLASEGFQLVIVSDAPQECYLCRPWEGKVLAIGGLPVPPAVASLDAARAAGLFHPGCRHSTGIYLPDITTVPTSTADPQGDADRQHLRYLERQVRAAKRREAVALDPAAKARARSSVRAYQAKIREHVATTSAKRQPAREQIGRAH